MLCHFYNVIFIILLDISQVQYRKAFLFGSSECKSKFLQTIPKVLNLGDNLSLHFCEECMTCPVPSATQLPVLTSTNPTKFSVTEYFTHLKTSHIGRLGLYLPVVTSSMVIVSNATLNHGFVAIPRRQTQGSGRNNNQWLSPEGCAMFSIQLHIPLDSALGRRLPMIQHLVALAVVMAVREGYESLDVRVKWPNDIYANGVTKIGGLIINSQLQSSQAIVNIGCGVNLNNSSPTLCVNDLIREYNSKDEGRDQLPLLGYEQMLALIFNKIEELFNQVQSQGDLRCLYDLYYNYWLHTDQRVTVKSDDGTEIQGCVAGIDEYGYLLVKTPTQKEPICVHPDGNSFDMMKGLIIPKYS